MSSMGSWRRRSRSRLILAVVCVAAALVAVGFVYIPETWLEQIGAAIQTVGAYLVSFGGRSWLFAVGGILVVCAVLLVVLPRRRPHPYWMPSPSAIAPVSVYVDTENQLNDVKLVRPFVLYLRRYLRENLRGQRADLLYFANATQPETRAAYKELYRFGFRPVDVPHAPFEDEKIKDAVDMELSLHAFDRALRGPEHQVFLIVTGDRDFLPLVFRLHALGHTVQIWAKQPPKAFYKIGSFLDNVRYVSLQEIFPPKTQARTEEARKEGQGAAKEGRGKALAYASDEPVSIQQAITFTLNTLQESSASVHAAPNPEMKFRQLLGGADGNFLRRFGFDRGDRVIAWLDALSALDILQPRAPSEAPGRGAADLEVAAMYMEQFLQQLAAVLVELADKRTDHVTTYAAAAQSVHAKARTDEPAELQRLRAMLAPSTHGWQIHTGYFCRAARSVGLVRFEEIPPDGTIRVNAPLSSSPALPETTSAPVTANVTEHDATPGGETEN